MKSSSARSFALGLAMVFVVTTATAAQETLQQVKDLYASAAYEDALGVLSSLQGSEQKLEIERYRVFCLLALDRTNEAEEAIKGILADDPLYSLDEAAPRVVELFNRVKRDATPQLAKALYSEGKSALDRKEKDAAIRKFEQLLQLTDDERVRDQVLVAELRLLAAGFLDLARAKPTPVEEAVAVVGAVPSATSPVIPPVVTPPVPVRQELPRWIPYDTASRATEYKGAVRVLISAEGKVEGAEIVTPTDRRYDRELLNAARRWTYQPATRNGVPIGSEKLVTVHLRPR